MSFLDVGPPSGRRSGPPPAHTTHTGGRPRRVGRLGGGAPGVTFPLCPCSTHSADRGNRGGVFSPISQWNPGLFFSSFRKAVLCGHSTSFYKRKLRSSRFPPLGARTSLGETGLAAVPGDWMSVLAACASGWLPFPPFPCLSTSSTAAPNGARLFLLGGVGEKFGPPPLRRRASRQASPRFPL